MSKDIKILQCYRTFYPESQGGLEHAILEMASNTPSSEVLTLSEKPGTYFVGKRKVLVTANKRWFSVASCCVGFGLLLSLRRHRAQLLHLHFPWPFGDIAYLLAGRSRPLVITYQSDIVRQRFLGILYRPLMHRFLKRADRIVATSQNYVDSSDVLKNYQDKVEVIPLGISEGEYPSPSQETLLSHESHCGRDFMLFVGVLRYYKGLEYLIRAAAQQPYKVVIAGKGPESLRLKQLAKKLGADNVIFLGYVSDEDKIALLQLCRAVVFPSHLRSEAFGISLVEGLMCGKPLISCEIGTGTSFVNCAGETGLVVEPANYLALREAMGEFWTNPSKARAMGKAARLRFDNLFTAKKMAETYKKLYSEVLLERGINING
ncbi:glycosyltransferase [Microbulbifer variabilis]|uniref:glycosyltransferase n=1 Tax=Microbulbifer variabilis TaxID=266805 RepID=UPI001CFE3E22|nr:glycosyltransferase [Microbulbifer variabilis]